MKILNFFKFLPLYLIALIPSFILYGISDILYIVLYRVVKYRRNVVQTNLKKSFPNKTRKEIGAIEKSFYHHLSDVFVESMKPLTWSGKKMLKHIRYKNPELLKHYYDQDKNIIIYTAHFGNWEWLISLPLITPYQVTTSYRKVKNSYVNELMIHLRSQYGVHCFEMKTSFRKIMQFERNNQRTLSVIIGDQSPDPISALHVNTFLGQKTAFLKGGEIIGRKLGAVVLFPSCKKVKRGVYEVTFEVLEESTKNCVENSVVDKYANWLEKDIYASPNLWLWTHRRWKSKSLRNIKD